jgi:hypothetical protein
MKVIISERQLDVFRKLCNEEETPLLNNGTVREKGDSTKVSTSATISDADGNPKPGKDVYADEVSKFQACQDWRGCLRQRLGY